MPSTTPTPTPTPTPDKPWCSLFPGSTKDWCNQNLGPSGSTSLNPLNWGLTGDFRQFMTRVMEVIIGGLLVIVATSALLKPTVSVLPTPVKKVLK